MVVNSLVIRVKQLSRRVYLSQNFRTVVVKLDSISTKG